MIAPPLAVPATEETQKHESRRPTKTPMASALPPFKIHLSDGRSFDVNHPDQILIFSHKVIVGVGERGRFPESSENCFLDQIGRWEDRVFQKRCRRCALPPLSLLVSFPVCCFCFSQTRPAVPGRTTFTAEADRDSIA